MNNRMSYADMFHEAMQETKKQIDQYFDKKVKEFEEKTTSKGYVPYVDPYPEELYDGLSSPHLYYMQHVLDLGWDVILFNRKIMAYKPAWVFRGQEFFDKEHKLPVSKGWEFNSTRENPIHLTLFHADKANELKLSWKEYTEKYL